MENYINLKKVPKQKLQNILKQKIDAQIFGFTLISKNYREYYNLNSIFNIWCLFSIIFDFFGFFLDLFFDSFE